MADSQIVIVGAGMAGVVAALELAHRGHAVRVLDRGEGAGGKVRQARIGDQFIDQGPTVFTMRWLFDRLFQDHGAQLDDHVVLEKLDVLARHTWPGSDHLDLLGSIDRSADMIEAFAGARDADGFRAFSKRAGEMFETLDRSFMQHEAPSAVSLTAHVGLNSPMRLWNIRPFAQLSSEVGRFFRDERLRQLFGRYATYCGSSPFLAPATLMLIAHAEQRGVWRIRGGMQQLITAIAGLAQKAGAIFEQNCEVERIDVASGRVRGVVTSRGETHKADTVVFCGDVAALQTGLLGTVVRDAAVPGRPWQRSLSAVTVAMLAQADGFEMHHHNVFFCADYRREFDDIFNHRRLPQDPTIYICAQDRGNGGTARAAPERLFAIINAPATGDSASPEELGVDQCLERMFSHLSRCGLDLRIGDHATHITTPSDFNKMFPATGGALYGMAMHGSMAAFRRPTSRTRIRGLYLAGGSVHPGPGLPMTATSGRLAAANVLKDLALTKRSRPAAMPGGISMRSAMMRNKH